MGKMMQLSYDLHTHTRYSHGKGSVYDNARAAAEKGLKIIGISDHGPGHYLFGMRMDDIPQMRKDIAAAQAAFPGLEILLGVEANICNLSGTLDVSTSQLSLFDYIMAGYHYGVLAEKPVQSLGVMLGGYLQNLTGRSSVRARNRNTDMVVNTLYSNKIRVITHPVDKIDADIDAVARACEETGTLMEINRRHNGLTVDGLKIAMKYDVRFILGSDAHRPEHVGEVKPALNRASLADLDLSRIVNLKESLI